MRSTRKINKGAKRLATWIGNDPQVEIAERLGVTPEELNRWLHGHRLPSLTRAVAIERVTRGEVPTWAWVS